MINNMNNWISHNVNDGRSLIHHLIKNNIMIKNDVSNLINSYIIRWTNKMKYIGWTIDDKYCEKLNESYSPVVQSLLI